VKVLMPAASLTDLTGSRWRAAHQKYVQIGTAEKQKRFPGCHIQYWDRLFNIHPTEFISDFLLMSFSLMIEDLEHEARAFCTGFINVLLKIFARY
jgi:hypothetical protein